MITEGSKFILSEKLPEEKVQAAKDLVTELEAMQTRLLDIVKEHDPIKTFKRDLVCFGCGHPIATGLEMVVDHLKRLVESGGWGYWYNLEEKKKQIAHHENMAAQLKAEVAKQEGVSPDAAK
jgi:hypothetical protein